MHNAGAGLVWGAAIGLLIGVIHGNLSHRLHTNTFVVGITLNVLALGLTSYLLNTVAMQPRQVGILTIPVLSRHPDRRADRCSPNGGPSSSSTRSYRSCGGSCSDADGASSSDRSARTREPPTSAASTSTGGAGRRCCGAARSAVSAARRSPSVRSAPSTPT